MEYDSADGNAADVGSFQEMPGNGLAFAVGVGGEVNGAGALCRLGKVLNGLLLVLRDFIEGLKVVRDVDAEAVLGKVPDVAQGGLDAKVLSQDFLDGPGLGGRFYDYEVCSHVIYAGVGYAGLVSLILT